MPLNFVRYTPGIETIDPNLDRLLSSLQGSAPHLSWIALEWTRPLPQASRRFRGEAA